MRYFILISLLSVGCSKMHSLGTAELEASERKSVAGIREVANLLATRCLKCHDNMSKNAGPVDILNMDRLQSDGWIVFGSPKDSPLLNAIAPDSGTMPKDAPRLTQSEYDLIYNWIATTKP